MLLCQRCHLDVSCPYSLLWASYLVGLHLPRDTAASPLADPPRCIMWCCKGEPGHRGEWGHEAPEPQLTPVNLGYLPPFLRSMNEKCYLRATGYRFLFLNQPTHSAFHFHLVFHTGIWSCSKHSQTSINWIQNLLRFNRIIVGDISNTYDCAATRVNPFPISACYSFYLFCFLVLLY